MPKKDGSKQKYSPPKLRVYGDLRKITQGGRKSKNEANTIAGPKTRPGNG